MGPKATHQGLRFQQLANGAVLTQENQLQGAGRQQQLAVGDLQLQPAGSWLGLNAPQCCTS